MFSVASNKDLDTSLEHKSPSKGDTVLAFEHRKIPVVFLQNKRARRMILRFDHNTSRIVVVLPSRVSHDEGRRFALQNKGWIKNQLALLPDPIPFADGHWIPYLGIEHRIHHHPEKPRKVWKDGHEIHVGGPKEFIARRIEEWLKQEARREIEQRVYEKAAVIGRRIYGLTLRDPKSRWGSCSAYGRLSFSWRLVLAPLPVLDYVVAHEVAHLRQMNHGPKFWKLAAELTHDLEWAKAWLQKYGPVLHRFGLIAN
ncbi:MAG: M48 family metallopeptidase [Alphaproteobacteria bacterium]|nr:M48 family metallopeptidase [Alphaproteobacteria bacterium]